MPFSNTSRPLMVACAVVARCLMAVLIRGLLSSHIACLRWGGECER
jgi:hypothetical protein